MSFSMFAAFAILACATVSYAAGSCGLTIGVLSSSGSLQPFRVKSFRSERGVELVNQFKGLHIESIPCGRYEYQLTHRVFDVPAADRSGIVYLESKDQWLSVATNPTLDVSVDGTVISSSRINPVGGRGIEISVDGLPPPKAVRWARVTDPFRNVVFEVTVDTTGVFLIPFSFNELVLIAILEPSGLVFQGDVDFRKIGIRRSVRLNAR
jgi:hypothetical protein